MSGNSLDNVAKLREGAALLKYTPAGAGAVATTVQEKLREFVSPFDFGAVGDGVADDTVAVQAAITAAAGKTLLLADGRFLVANLTASSSFSIRGRGIIRRKPAASGVLLTLSGSGAVYDFADVIFDGNHPAQTPSDTMHTIVFAATGTTTTQARLVVQTCTFVKGNGADISVFNGNDRATSNEFFGVYACRFLGGREGTSTSDDPRYIDIRSPVSYIVEGSVFDFLGTPTIGRAGIVCYDGYSETSTDKARGVIANNLLQNVGRAEPSSTLGAIDIYNYARSTSITGNTLINPYGRGIQVKADAENIAITGNVVDGLLGSFTNAQIVVNSAQRNSAVGTVTIQSNSLRNSSNDGIVYTGRDLADTEYAKCISIGGNTISNCTRRAISVAYVNDVVISNNVVNGAGTDGIYAQGIKESLVVTGNRIAQTTNSAIYVDATSAGAWMNIQGNHIQNAGSRGVYLGSAAAGQITNNNIRSSALAAIEVRDTAGSFLVQDNVIASAIPLSRSGTTTDLRMGANMCQTAPGFSLREVTIASGVITVFQDWHYVDTEGDAATDDLDTINGGSDGYLVTFRAASAARDVVFKDGTGNMRLNGDFTLSHSDDTITLRFMAGVWYELCRSDNAT